MISYDSTLTKKSRSQPFVWLVKLISIIVTYNRVPSPVIGGNEEQVAEDSSFLTFQDSVQVPTGHASSEFHSSASLKVSTSYLCLKILINNI